MLSSLLPAKPVRTGSYRFLFGGEGGLLRIAGHRHGTDPLGQRLDREVLLAMDGQVTDFQDLVLVPGAPQDQTDQLHEDEGDGGRPQDHEDGRSGLFPQLVCRARVDETTDAERRTRRRLRGVGEGHLSWTTRVLDHARISEDTEQE